MIKRAVALAVTLFASNIHADCYTLYGSDHAIISAGYTPPFDIGLPNKSAEWTASQARGEYLIITHHQCDNTAPNVRNQTHDLKLGLPVLVDTHNQRSPMGGGITVIGQDFATTIDSRADRNSSGYSNKHVHVDAYTRRDGTHVRSHYRSRPHR
ncbi:hypothetical protein [Thiospirillum jenense]|uniref:Uncharacterized protein n=1 Tax=Thiospirillum jenense TaxID=1653858 RepID=A0A839HES3_9GAMM|nr:hypothetical protein [Thiospirillum jenense]MBB1125529.1 hypothetical protein [Thiospirillum jenense]